MFVVSYQDHLDHEHWTEFDSLDEARDHYNWCLQQPIEEYDYAYELIVDDETIDSKIVQEFPPEQTLTISPSGFTVGLYILHLFTLLSINMFLSVSNIKSSSVEELSINVATNQAVVRYVGSERPYLYTGVDFKFLDFLPKTTNDSCRC